MGAVDLPDADAGVGPLERPLHSQRGRVKTGCQQGDPLVPLCHAAVSRAIAEALGLRGVRPGMTPLMIPLDPPPVLGVGGFFADGGGMGRVWWEAGRAAAHTRRHIGGLGLRFGKLEAAPAVPAATRADVAALRRAGCAWREDGNLDILRAPIGEPSWCQRQLLGRADTTGSCSRGQQGSIRPTWPFTWPGTRLGASTTPSAPPLGVWPSLRLTRLTHACVPWRRAG